LHGVMVPLPQETISCNHAIDWPQLRKCMPPVATGTCCGTLTYMMCSLQTCMMSWYHCHRRRWR
jgi:hypothetical protein